ncbi:MAG TPA: hypothetical protein VNO21_03615 [Polyangiaceae bacterium]|nr:hypothetical protein [Polyangiaceae bacterium]
MIRLHLQTAQSAPSTSSEGTTSDSRATQFQAVEGGPETRNGGTLMVEAYTVLWVILMAWLFLLWRKQAALNARIDDLDRILDKAAARRPSSAQPLRTESPSRAT